MGVKGASKTLEESAPEPSDHRNPQAQIEPERLSFLWSDFFCHHLSALRAAFSPLSPPQGTPGNVFSTPFTPAAGHYAGFLYSKQPTNNRFSMGEAHNVTPVTPGHRERRVLESILRDTFKNR